jgi:hypothetical protein
VRGHTAVSVVGRCVSQDRPAGTVFRPHAIYNPVTSLYVLYWNYVYPNGTYAGNAVATSSVPAGPFSLQVPVMNVSRGNGGDFDVLGAGHRGAAACSLPAGAGAALSVVRPFAGLGVGVGDVCCASISPRRHGAGLLYIWRWGCGTGCGDVSVALSSTSRTPRPPTPHS